MRGIISAAGYVPYRRLDRRAISATLGTLAAKGTRAVAGHDEDTTTMGVEAARLALRNVLAANVGAVWFSTPTPAYLDKTNATALHAALRLGDDVPALDFGGALRSGVGAAMVALGASGSPGTLVVVSDMRDGLPGGPDESYGGDGAAALLVGEGSPLAPVIAEHLASASATEEFVERWRAPGERRSKLWEERFGETRYLSLARDAFDRACKHAGIEAHDIDRLVVAGMHQRAVKSVATKIAGREGAVADDLTSSVGQAGAAHGLLVLADQLEQAAAGEVLALVNLADGADVIIVRATDAIEAWSASCSVRTQLDAGADLSYGKFLAWRGMITPEPPRRPEPQRVSAPAAWRSGDWKFGFVGSQDRSSGAIHLPPSRVSRIGGAVDDMDPIAMANATGTVVTFTIDRMAYSPSPPVVFAVVDFDGGGRFPVELTDVDAEVLRIGDKVEMTFRRLFSADGIHDYFWKAKPLRGSTPVAHSQPGR